MRSRIKTKRIVCAVALLLASAVCLSACSLIKGYIRNGFGGGSTATPDSGTQSGIGGEISANVETGFSSKDTDSGYTEAGSFTFVLKDGATQADTAKVEVSGDVVTVTAEGTYVF